MCCRLHLSASMSPWSSSLGLYSWMELSMANDICFEPVEPPNKVVVSPRVSKFDKIWWIWPGLNLKFRLVSIKLVWIHQEFNKIRIECPPNFWKQVSPLPQPSTTYATDGAYLGAPHLTGASGRWIQLRQGKFLLGCATTLPVIDSASILHRRRRISPATVSPPPPNLL
jgi:hypothetical protein